jgi:hypothetical protein
LELPSSAKIHDVFHVSLLEAYHTPRYPGQVAEPPGPVEITEEGEEYEVANIVDSRPHPRAGRLEYLVEWLGYEGTDEHTSWEPKENVFGSEFHERLPRETINRRQAPPNNKRRKAFSPRIDVTTRHQLQTDSAHRDTTLLSTSSQY